MKQGPVVKYEIERSLFTTIILMALLAAVFGGLLYLMQTSSTTVSLLGKFVNVRYHIIVFTITNTFVALIVILFVAWAFSDIFNKPCFQEKAARNLERFIQQHLEEQDVLEKITETPKETPKDLDNPNISEIL